MKTNRFDSLIFDMDGTLWDAIDSYCAVWDASYRQMGFDISVDRATLVDCMGMVLDDILNRIAPDHIDKARFYSLLKANEAEMMPKLGGILYPGVKEYIPELAKKYRLFMVSNCGAAGLKNFLSYTGLHPYFEDTLTHGETGYTKEGNIRHIIQKHALTAPLYIGDTDSDCRSAHAAGASMLHVTYGFGQCNDADITAGSFTELADKLLN